VGIGADHSEVEVELSERIPDSDQGEGALTPQAGRRRWSTATKRIVAVTSFVLLALVIYTFSTLLRPLMLAFLVAFILNPVVDLLEERVGLHRNLATILVFLVLVLALLGILAAPAAAVPTGRRAILSIQVDLRRLIDDFTAFLAREIAILGFEFDLTFVVQELSAALRGVVEALAQGALDVLVGIAQGLFWLVFILIIAFYTVRDSRRITRELVGLAPPGYREDSSRLLKELAGVWNAFLRGELLLGLVVGTAVGVMTTALGLPYPWALGLFAGVLELIPRFGPFIAAIPGVLLALIQGSAFIPLGNFWFAVVVAGAYALIQFVENNVLIPRILGSTLDLHPLAVLIAVLAGGYLAGILGILLAAPTLATFRVLGRYILARMYDQDPFAEPLAGEPKEIEPPDVTKIVEAGEAALEHLRDKLKETRKEYAEDPDSGSTGSRQS